jgi:hypothetical protein
VEAAHPPDIAGGTDPAQPHPDFWGKASSAPKRKVGQRGGRAALW